MQSNDKNKPKHRVWPSKGPLFERRFLGRYTSPWYRAHKKVGGSQRRHVAIYELSDRYHVANMIEMSTGDIRQVGFSVVDQAGLQIAVKEAKGWRKRWRVSYDEIVCD